MTPSPPTQSTARRALLTATRMIVGYLAAVATGAVLFVLSMTPFLGWQEGNAVGTFIRMVREYFALGALFGIPYTVLGTIAFKLWLPKTKTAFLLLGAICPASAALLLMFMADALYWAAAWSFVGIIALTLPAGLAAAYVYGAIGFGLGFGRWRFQ